MNLSKWECYQLERLNFDPFVNIPIFITQICVYLQQEKNLLYNCLVSLALDKSLTD